jgi:hypothetical protein
VPAYIQTSFSGKLNSTFSLGSCEAHSIDVHKNKTIKTDVIVFFIDLSSEVAYKQS